MQQNPKEYGICVDTTCMKLSTKVSAIAISVTTLLCIIVAYIFNTNLRNTLYGEKYSEAIYAIQMNIRGIEQRCTQVLLHNTTIQTILHSLERFALSAIDDPSYTMATLKEKELSLTVYSNTHTVVSQFGLDINTKDVLTTLQEDDVAFSIPSEDILLIHKRIALPDGNGYIVASQRLLIHNTPISTLLTDSITQTASVYPAFTGIQSMAVSYIQNTPGAMHTIKPHFLKLIQQYVQTNITAKQQSFYSIDTTKHTMLALYYEPKLSTYAIAEIDITALDGIIHSFYLFIAINSTRIYIILQL